MSSGTFRTKDCIQYAKTSPVQEIFPPLCILCRDGLFSRPSQNEQSQISIDMGPQFDLDNEVEGLSGQVGKLKNVSLNPRAQSVTWSQQASVLSANTKDALWRDWSKTSYCDLGQCFKNAVTTACSSALGCLKFEGKQDIDFSPFMVYLWCRWPEQLVKRSKKTHKLQMAWWALPLRIWHLEKVVSLRTLGNANKFWKKSLTLCRGLIVL